MTTYHADAPIQIKIVILHRKRALDKGFQWEDFGVWIDIVSQWLFSQGAKDSVFGSEKDEIFVEGCFATEPSATLLGDVVLRENFKTKSPIMLEDFDPYTFNVILRAWRYVFKVKVNELQKVSDLAQGFLNELKGVIGQMPSLRQLEQHSEAVNWAKHSIRTEDDDPDRESHGA